MLFKRKIAFILAAVVLLTSVPVFANDVGGTADSNNENVSTYATATPTSAVVGNFDELQQALRNGIKDIKVTAEIKIEKMPVATPTTRALKELSLNDVTITADTYFGNIFRITGSNVTIEGVTFNITEADDATAISIGSGADRTIITGCTFNLPQGSSNPVGATGIVLSSGVGSVTITGNNFNGLNSSLGVFSKTPMYIEGSVTADRIILIDNNTITGNFRNPTKIKRKAIITNNTFEHTTAYLLSVNDGIALYFQGEGPTGSTVENNTFIIPESSAHANALIGLNDGGAGVSKMKFASFKDNIFINNCATGGTDDVPAVVVIPGGEAAFEGHKDSNINTFNSMGDLLNPVDPVDPVPKETRSVFYYNPTAKVEFNFVDGAETAFTDDAIIKVILADLWTTSTDSPSKVVLKEVVDADGKIIRYTTPAPVKRLVKTPPDAEIEETTAYVLSLGTEIDGYIVKFEDSNPVLKDGNSIIKIVVIKTSILTLDITDDAGPVDLADATITVTDGAGIQVDVSATELQYIVENGKKYTVTVTLDGYEDFTTTTDAISKNITLPVKLVKKSVAKTTSILTLNPFDKGTNTELRGVTYVIKDSLGNVTTISSRDILNLVVKNNETYTITAQLAGFNDITVIVSDIIKDRTVNIIMEKILTNEGGTTSGGDSSGGSSSSGGSGSSGGTTTGKTTTGKTTSDKTTSDKTTTGKTTIIDEEKTPLGTPKKFVDIPEQFSWAEGAINRLVELEVISGVTSNTFEPGGTCTRAQFAVIITKLYDLKLDDANKNAYSDVKSDAWYYDFISIVSSHGIFSGYEDGEFKPNKPITRQELAFVLGKIARKYNLELPVVSTKVLSDMDTVQNYAKSSVELLVNAGIINGYEDGSFRPLNDITRAEAAVLIDKFIAIVNAK